MALSFSSTSTVGRLSFHFLSSALRSYSARGDGSYATLFKRKGKKCSLKFFLFVIVTFYDIFFHQYVSSNPQCKNFGLEGNEMWLAASADRRVSVWVADWWKDKCDLLDWLTFPAPAYFGVPSVF